ncbi:hypothetical protein [Lysobacter olei]
MKPKHPLALESAWSNAVHFIPLVGPEYDDGLVSDVRVLLLGESHYGDDSAAEGFGRDCTQYWFQDYLNESYDIDGDSQFFRKLPRILARDVKVTQLGSAAAWRRAAYANFVQALVGERARTRPSRQQWLDGQRALTEMAEKLQPDVVLVLGAQLWSHITEGCKSDEAAISAQKRPREVWLIPNGTGGYARASWIYHPSTNYESLESAIGVLSTLIKRATDEPLRGHNATRAVIQGY